MTDKRAESAALRKRDQYGLCEGITYIFKDDGTINWRAMVNPEFVYVNEKYFTDKAKTPPTSTEGLEDRECLVSLAGLKELLCLRGYDNVDFQVLNDRDGTVTIKCTIHFIANYETGGPISRSDIATAGTFNVDSKFMPYSHTIAANRAMARAIRSALNIHVVSSEEVGDVTTETPEKKSSSFEPYPMVMDRVNSKGLTFEEVVVLCAENKVECEYTSFEEFKNDGSFLRKLLKILPKTK